MFVSHYSIVSKTGKDGFKIFYVKQNGKIINLPLRTKNDARSYAIGLKMGDDAHKKKSNRISIF